MSITYQDTLAWLNACAQAINENRDYLTELDAAIGDADHGANMARGFNAVVQKIPSVADQDIGSLLKTVGMTLVSTVGGAAGPLYGTFFLQAAMKLTGLHEMTLEDWTTALEAGINGVVMRGKAQAGDKTMLDALLPALEALKQNSATGDESKEALTACAEAARIGMEATIPLVARKGRASYLGERSAGHQDPGATSSFIILKAAADCWNKPE